MRTASKRKNQWSHFVHLDIQTHIYTSTSQNNRCSFPNYVRWFLGAFAKLRKATISCVMPVRLPICPHETIRPPLDGLSLTWNLSIFRKTTQKIQVSLK